MTEAALEALLAAVRSNCLLSDARYAQEQSLCNYLLAMREYYRWEHGLALDAEPPRHEVLRWVAQREADWEAELGVVIGRTARRVERDEALTYVAGYTCLNDLSARDLQRSGGQWTRGKAIDGFLPMGPWLVTADDVPDPQRLAISCSVDGETVQRSTTAEMVFGVAELISIISQTMTLEPGDLIVTGTPAGVGMSMDPPRFLRPGQEVIVEIERIGRLATRLA